jgi:hypothetical protein
MSPGNGRASPTATSPKSRGIPGFPGHLRLYRLDLPALHPPQPIATQAPYRAREPTQQPRSEDFSPREEDRHYLPRSSWGRFPGRLRPVMMRVEACTHPVGGWHPLPQRRGENDLLARGARGCSCQLVNCSGRWGLCRPVDYVPYEGCGRRAAAAMGVGALLPPAERRQAVIEPHSPHRTPAGLPQRRPPAGPN